MRELPVVGTVNVLALQISWMGGGDGTHNSLLISRIPSIQEPARSQ